MLFYRSVSATRDVTRGTDDGQRTRFEWLCNEQSVTHCVNHR